MIINQLIQDLFLYLHVIRSTHSISEFVFMFFLFSFLGWVLEVIYRSIRQRQLVNPGILSGPIVPIYGVGGTFILLTHILIMHESILIRLVIYFCAISTLEFLTGEAMLRVFRKRYWDYTEDILNLRGHVCLPFSIAWAVISIIVETAVYPVLCQIFLVIPTQIILATNIVAIFIIQIDVIYSMNVIDKVLVIFQNKIRPTFPARNRFIEYFSGFQFISLNMKTLKLRIPETPHLKIRVSRLYVKGKENRVFGFLDRFLFSFKDEEGKFSIQLKKKVRK